MNEYKLKWCLEQDKGIKRIEPKPHLGEAYMREADETLDNVARTTGKWKVITAYYACYNAVYALLMCCGIKCEIHDCTLALMQLFDFNSADMNFLRALKEQRIQNQYYLKHVDLSDEDKVKKFVLKCKELLSLLSSDKIEEIRAKLGEVK